MRNIIQKLQRNVWFLAAISLIPAAACTSATLKRTGFSDFAQVQLAEIGLSKGTSPATPENIERVIIAARERF